MDIKIKYLNEDALQRLSEFESGMAIGSLHLDPALKAHTVWTTYTGDLMTVDGKLSKYIIECANNNEIVIIGQPKGDMYILDRVDITDSITVYRPLRNE